ncbi:formylglycine-generating enzyme family protein [Blastopirellula sp. JC732]|uniref:Formylglycine-generating enzyme family protein n=1 Tax=Blastopirellula sediminis TaxID=2894196 RepID=A0A9X1MPI3_9BACT|nr:SUMF1/EgtB/PvdO family nonheme iron enzyme [Blastopirellula sediminis]MCC9606243.1 formylglycine-generating enzyme family protein [Blastopirellula sediminis]MCC9630459.1 formylglycine-generating enzyme family protein [Blastopirellula sediminis]
MRIASACLIALLMAVSTAAAAETLGISKTKPAEGPYVEIDGGFMVPYEITIPGTEVQLSMVPVPGGKRVMGEGASAYTVKVEPFWMQKTETNWAQYKEFMRLYDLFKQLEGNGVRLVTDDNKIDAITIPTPLYEPTFTYENGEDPEQAAVTMTQYSAMQYSKWISGVSGKQYRLPSEAEWEHAASGGVAGPYSFGDADKIGDYAWYAENSDGAQHKVGEQKPNQYGLYDMNGNVWEWVLDAYSEEAPAALAGKTVTVAEAIQWPTKPFPLCSKGGSWDDDAENCEVTSKLGSHDDDWKGSDPNIPLSPWWFTEYPSTCVGFRLIRPLTELPKAEMIKYWDSLPENLQFDVADRLNGGRGVLGLVDEKLPEAIKQLDE